MLDKSIELLSEKDYESVLNELQEYCLNNITTILMFGEFGNPSCPSISDLDVFICLDTKNFKRERGKIINFIKANKKREYLFFHDPLIICIDMLDALPKRHTLYNLKLTYNVKSIEIPVVKKESIDILQIIWTSFLMVSAPNCIVNDRSVRDKLLILKNLCQSIENIDPKSKALKFSAEIRDLVLKNNITLLEFNSFFHTKMLEFFEKSNEIQIGDIIKYSKKDKFQIYNNVHLFLSDKNEFFINGEVININLNKTFFYLFEQFYFKKSRNVNIEDYIKSSIEKSDIPSPFIFPFSYNFFRTDIRFYIKRFFYLLKDAL